MTVPEERLTRRYHRRWRATTGKYQALMRFRDALDPDGALRQEGHRGRHMLGVPLFISRELLTHLIGWLKTAVARRSDGRFLHETRIWYCVGFIRARWRDQRKPSRPAAPVLQRGPV